MITYRCQCGQTLQVGDELTGCKVRCPKCRAAMLVPLLENMPPKYELPPSDAAPTVSSNHDLTINPADKVRGRKEKDS